MVKLGRERKKMIETAVQQLENPMQGAVAASEQKLLHVYDVFVF